jgi:hypothetical protein
MTFDLSIISKDTMTFHAMMVDEQHNERRDRFLFITTALFLNNTTIRIQNEII